jgi:hypothetical protein
MAGFGNLNLPDVPEPSISRTVRAGVAHGHTMKRMGADQGFDLRSGDGSNFFEKFAQVPVGMCRWAIVGSWGQGPCPPPSIRHQPVPGPAPTVNDSAQAGPGTAFAGSSDTVRRVRTRGYRGRINPRRRAASTTPRRPAETLPSHDLAWWRRGFGSPLPALTWAYSVRWVPATCLHQGLGPSAQPALRR